MTVDVTAGSGRQRRLTHDIGRCWTDPERAIVASDRCDAGRLAGVPAAAFILDAVYRDL
jgi:hypothetical protein